MAQLFNSQRVLGVRLVEDGTAMHNGLPVLGVTDATGQTFVDNDRVLGVDVLDADKVMHNDQRVRGAVLVDDGRKLYGFQPVIPAQAVSGSFGILGWTELLAWWDSSEGVTTSGGAVSSWVDRKNARNMAQAISSQRPAYSATSFGGAPGLTFDGSDDYLELASQPFPGGSGAVEIWGVVSQDAAAGSSGLRSWFSYGENGSSFQRRVRRTIVGGVNRANALVGGTSIDGATVDFTSRHLVRCVVGSTETSLAVDGNTPVTSAVVPATGTVRARIGATSDNAAGQFWLGKVRDIILTLPLSAEKAVAMKDFLLARKAL